MEITEKKQVMKVLMRDIIVDISWANISKKYFGKSRSWLSQKMNGFDGNKSETEFARLTPSEEPLATGFTKYFVPNI